MRPLTARLLGTLAMMASIAACGSHPLASTDRTGTTSPATNAPSAQGTPQAARGHEPPSLVIDGHSVELNTETPLAGCDTSPDSEGNPVTQMSWAGGTPTGPDVSGEGHPGITVILAHVAPVTGNDMSIQLPTLQSYVATGGDPKSGTVMVTGPGNGWYTFSGTIAEEVRSEADGHIISGEDGPLHQFSVKIECATYGQPVATAAPTDCDFDKTMQHMLNPGNDLPKPPTVEEYAGQNGWTTEQLRDFFADFCGDKAFRNMAGLLDPQKAVGVDPAASALEYFLTRCNLIDNSSPEDNAKFIAADGQVSTADAQAEVQKLRSHGCPRK